MSQSNTGLTFDPTTGLSAPDTATIRAEIASQFQNAFGQDLDTDSATPQGQLIDSLTSKIAEKNANILFLANQFNPYTATGLWQEALGALYFLHRKVAQPTLVECTCTGLIGTVISAGSLADDNLGNRYKALQSVTIPESGSVTVQFANIVNGAISCPLGALSKIVTVTPGWDTILNSTAGVLGRETETQAEFENRRYQSVSQNGHGTVAALYGNIVALEEVQSLLILENVEDQDKEDQGVIISPHSVYISVVGGADIDIAKAIYEKLSAGCGTTGTSQVSYTDPNYNDTTYTYNIVRPANLSIYVRVELYETSTTPANIEELVKAAVLNNFNGLSSSSKVEIGDEIRASRFYGDVTAVGASGLLSITVARQEDLYLPQVSVDANEYPTLDISNIDVVISTRE